MIEYIRLIRPLGQEVKTSPFHGGIVGSIPAGVTNQVKGEPVPLRRRLRLYRIFLIKGLSQVKKRLAAVLLLQENKRQEKQSDSNLQKIGT